MKKNEARKYMIEQIQYLFSINRSADYIRGQLVGMVKAFKAAGVIEKENTDILDDLLEMI